MSRTKVVLNEDDYDVLQSLIHPPYRLTENTGNNQVALSDRNGIIKFQDSCSAGTNSLYVPSDVTAVNGFRFTVVVPVAYTGGISLKYYLGSNIYWSLPCDPNGLGDVSYEIIVADGEMSVIGSGSAVSVDGAA